MSDKTLIEWTKAACKKAGGDLLDGQRWHQFPVVTQAEGGAR